MGERGARVLVVDDEQGILRFLQASLVAHGYLVDEASTGEQALQAVRATRPDVIILDLGLPDVDGKEIMRCLREWNQAPIIVLSVRDDEHEKIAALDAGADDYLIKPFAPGELLARIRATLRRIGRSQRDSLIKVGELSVDLAKRLVQIGPRAVQLTPTEYDLLKVLILDAGKVFTHQQLIHAVWGRAHYGNALHLLHVNISNLRRKLESGPAYFRYIVTEPGVGYRLRTESL